MKRRFYILALSIFLLPLITHASNISTTDKYAWSDVLGWVNFSPTNGNVEVTDTRVTGYVWSTNAGWINLQPTKGGISNNRGVLSGYAWGESTGYIDFTGVSIDSSGRFTGQTVSTALAGTITFSCAKCNVNTTWRIPSTTSSSRSGSRVLYYLQQPFTFLSNIFSTNKTNTETVQIDSVQLTTPDTSTTTRPIISTSTKNTIETMQEPVKQTFFKKVLNVITYPLTLLWRVVRWIF